MAKTIQLSPSSLNFFLECPHCFWLDKKHGVKRPVPYAFSLNTAIDDLLKEEFDDYRRKGLAHPLLENNGIEARLFTSQRLINQWRSGKAGIRFFDKKLQATLFGAPDDVLEFSKGKVAPFDYKSTDKSPQKVFDIFQLQLDTYSFLLEKNGYKTTGKGYIAFYFIDKSRGFIDRLPFRKEVMEIQTNPQDIYEIFKDAVALLEKEDAPEHSADCEFKKWFDGEKEFEKILNKK